MGLFSFDEVAVVLKPRLVLGSPNHLQAHKVPVSAMAVLTPLNCAREAQNRQLQEKNLQLLRCNKTLRANNFEIQNICTPVN